MTEKLLYDQDGHVVTLTFNMPETQNALTDMDLCAAIVEACTGSTPISTSAAPSSPARARRFPQAATSST